jgi:hypothetical protein
MSDKAKSDSHRLDRILDRLAEYVQSAPGEELLEDARREGHDPAKTTARVKGLFRQALKNYQGKQIEAAQAAYERTVTAMKSRTISLPKTPMERRSLLAAVFAKQPQLKAAFTFQNRGFSELTDEDIENHLRKLALLGVLNVVKPPEEHE